MHPLPSTFSVASASMFPDLDVETAPEASRPALRDAVQRFGAIPSPLARIAASPLVLSSLDVLFDLWARTSLSPLEREVVVMTVARINGCAWCARMHVGILHAMKADPALVSALRTGAPIQDERLAALAAFTEAVMATRGEVDDAGGAAFAAAGYTAAQALEVVLGVGVFTLTTYANRLTRAPLPG